MVNMIGKESISKTRLFVFVVSLMWCSVDFFSGWFYTLPLWYETMSVFVFLPGFVLTGWNWSSILLPERDSDEEDCTDEEKQKLIKHCRKLTNKVGYGSSIENDTNWISIGDKIITDEEIYKHLKFIDEIVNSVDKFKD